MTPLLLNWNITGNRITFNYQGLDIFFEMPDYVTDLPRREVLHLAEWMMLSPWHDVPPLEHPLYPKPCPSDKHVLLCFSAGVDSTAALQLMPNCCPVYVERHGTGKRSLLNQEAHIHFCEQIGAIRIRTNFELIRTKHGKMTGYSTGRGMAVPILLLSDALGAAGIAYGAVFDDNTFAAGYFRALTSGYHARQSRFRAAGLHCVEPLFGCSEVISTNIVQQGAYKDLARSCLRGTTKKTCGRCYKCFRKSLLLGQLPSMNPEAEKSIAKNPPKMAGPLIYGMQKAGWTIPGMEYAKDMPVEWLSRCYSPLLKELPDGMKLGVIENLRLYYIDAMTQNDIDQMKQADFRRKEDS